MSEPENGPNDLARMFDDVETDVLLGAFVEHASDRQVAEIALAHHGGVDGNGGVSPRSRAWAVAHLSWQVDLPKIAEAIRYALDEQLAEAMARDLFGPDAAERISDRRPTAKP